MPALEFPIKKAHHKWAECVFSDFAVPLQPHAGNGVRAEKCGASGKPAIGFRSEVPDNAATYEDIVLVALAGVHIQVRHT